VRREYTDGTVEHIVENCEICRSSSTALCEHAIVVIASDGQMRLSLERSLLRNAKIWQELANAEVRE